MVFIAGLIIAFSFAQLLVAAINLLFSRKLKQKNNYVSSLVSVLIPARNEEQNIPLLLADLQKQPYNNIEIIVFNDQSTDDTEKIVADFAKTDPRIKLINSGNLPDGWLGKNYACHKLAEHAGGSYYLFLDADVRIKNNIIASSIAYAEKNNITLISVFPLQVMKTFGEWITVPLMNYILLSLLPLILVPITPHSALAAANGQFMLFNAESYKKFLPHKIMKSQKVEDIEIARYLKYHNERIICVASETDIACRMYRNYREAVNGFSKNIFTFFGNSFILSLIFWLITTFGFIPVIICMPALVFKIYLIVVFLTRLFISITSHQSIILNLLLCIPQQLSLGIMNYAAIANKIKARYVWKGRLIG
jgi:glycosyltransferase involved in cell wall biosynthesis